MNIKAAFIFIAPEVDSAIHRSVITSPVVELTIVGVKDYNEAVTVAKKLADDGNVAIELCAGFGNEGVAKIAKAVKNKATVGVVRFDFHPALNFQSGDSLF